MIRERVEFDSPQNTDIVLSQGHNLTSRSPYDISIPGPSNDRGTIASTSGERSMRRKAMNRACNLGQLYSGVRDEIMPEFMLDGEVPEGALVSVDMKQTYLTWEEEFSTEDKFKSLEVEGELKLSIMLGLADVKGASKYLTSATKSTTCVRICMVYRVVTKEETLNLQHEEVVKRFSLEALHDTPATHVVVGIQWGYSGVIVFEQSVTDFEDRASVEASLKASLKTGLASSMIGNTLSSKLSPVKLGGGFIPKLMDRNDENLKRRSVKIIADVMPETAIEPNDFQSALEFARSVGDIKHMDINGGRGKPQEIHLLSVEAVCQRLRSIFIVEGALFRTLSRNIMIAVEKELEKLADMMQMLTLTYEEVESRARRSRIPPYQLTNFEAVQTDLLIGISKFQGDMRDLLVAVRSCVKEEEDIQSYLSQFRRSKYSSAGLEENLKSLNSYKEKVTFLESMTAKGVEILGDDTDPESLVTENIGVSSLYILCYDDKHRVHRSAVWTSNYELFEELAEQRADANSKLFLLDYANGRFWDRDHDVCIKLYRGGLWNNDYLTTVNSTRLSSDDMNILLLGQSGVGKSTFINAFYNYLSYDTLQEAEQGGVKVAIPSQFTETDQSLNTNTITVGDNSLEDENFEDPSQSSTQRCKSYLFNIEPESNKRGIAVRLIDTPGIGDTRGEAWDKKNFENILAELKKYTHIHGICIFLKPNESRLSVMLEYCIMELLIHLHKNASRNMVFCFTSAKATNFHVGDTLKPLRALLDSIHRKKQVKIQISESTMYCFDNEAFRYLAARQELGGKTQTRSPVRSWNQSVNECIRLLSQFNSVGPHLIEETVSVIRVKQIIDSLEEPMMTLTEQIIENSVLIKEKKKEIEATEENLEALRKVIMKPTRLIESSVEKLDHSRTVCTNPKCTTTRVTTDGRTESIFRVCHDPCTGHESSWRMLERVWLRLCSHMVRGKCITCHCPARDHKFVTYEIKQTIHDMSEEPEDNQELKLLEEGKSATVVKKLALKWYQKKMDTLEKEKKYINDAQIKFAFFLQEDSFISSTNEYKSRYLEREIIQLENELRNSDRDLDQNTRKKVVYQIEVLKTRAEKYKKELREFAEFLKQGKQNSDEISLEKIKTTLEGLTKLQHCGPVFARKLAMEDADMQLDDSCLDFEIDWTLDREEKSLTSLAAKLVTMAVHRQRSRVCRD
ncbi:hypothetical protein R1flu_028189 [Riccia fluitans]|uniref:G domain-containing protein n=1 Tax=Riccia fluitans TaxID=41844 RepID=A0ABD1XNU0_9MARC